MNKLSPEQRGYHAAALDSEGTINIGKRTNNDYYTPAINVTNTYLSFLIYLKQTSGIGDIIPGRSETKIWKKSYKWALSKYVMKEYIEEIIDLLIIKRQQAGILLEFLPLIKIHHSKCNPPSLDNLAMREILYDELRILNKRGPCDLTNLEIHRPFQATEVTQ